MLDNEKWYKSPIVWAMLIQTAISVLLTFQEWYIKRDYSVPGIISFIVAVLVIILRVWLNKRRVEIKKETKFKDESR